MFSENSFRIIIRMSNSLDPDQAQHFVRPDLGPNDLQGYQQKILVLRQRVKEHACTNVYTHYMHMHML